MLRRFSSSVSFVVLLVALFSVHASGADWPMWRCDAGRSAATTQQLAPELHLQWVREYPPLEPAWPDEPRMRFDVCYEPVIKSKTVFVNSPRSDSVFALDAATGAVKWTFYAGGPVRFAPLAWKDKLYFASDDGYLYCLAAADGRLVWKFLGVPTERKLLGNKRLISAWPARGAPVMADDKIYFAAGIWPFMGVFIYCLDAETGQVVWENSGTGAMYINQPHSSPAFAGVAPQGYLVAEGDRLLVPGGRSVPACFDLDTGKFLYYQLATNTKRGHFRVATLGKYFFNCGNVYNLADGELVAGVGGVSNSNPYAYSISTALVPTARPDLKCAVVTEDAIYGASEGNIAAYDIKNPELNIGEDSKGRKINQSKIPELWRLNTGAKRVWLKAGPRLYASKDNLVMAVDLPKSGAGKPSTSWQAEIEGTPGAMAAADDRLFVVTLEGRIYCFGRQTTQPTTYAAQDGKPAAARDEWTRKAREIIRQTGVKEGYCLVWGVGTGRLAEELARWSGLHVVVIDPDADKIAGLRTRLDAAGLYGARIAAHAGDPLAFQFPPYIASLIVSEDLSAAGIDAGQTFAQKIFYPLRPYGGVACLPIPADKQASFARSVAAAGLQNAEVSHSRGFTLLRRAGALPGSADWTHHYADAANTCVSKDAVVKAPLGLLWFGGSSNATILPRHGHGPSEQIVDGRLFIEGADTMRAMDVYTGRQLWQVQLPGIGTVYNTTGHQPGASSLGSNHVSTSDAIYVAYGRRCLVLDPATGRSMSEFRLPAESGAENTPTWGYIGVYQNLLVAGSSPLIFEGEKTPGGKDNWDATSSKQIVAMDRYSGRVLWTFESTFCFRHNTIAIGADKLFCIDRLPDAEVEKMNRRGEASEGNPKLRCLDVRTGEVLWETTENVFGTWLGYSEEHDVLLQAGRPSRDMLPNEPGDRMIAYRGETGEVLWDKPHRYNGPCLLHGETIITQTISLGTLGKAFSLLTGEQLMRKNPITGVEAPWQFGRNYGCNTVVGSEHLITFRSAAAGYFDLMNDGGTGNLGGFKSGCSSNLLVANGVLNAPDYTRTCTCSYQNQTSLAFVHMPDVETWTFNTCELGEGSVKRVGINLGAPGDRRAPDGMMWLDYPSVGGPSPDISVSITPEQPEWFRRHSSRVSGDGLRWVAACGAKGLTSLKLTLDKNAEEDRSYTVTLYFMEPDEARPGDRVFDVALQGRDVLKNFDIANEAGRPHYVVVMEFRSISVKEHLMVTLKPSGPAKTSGAVLCGVAVAAEAQ